LESLPNVQSYFTRGWYAFLSTTLGIKQVELFPAETAVVTVSGSGVSLEARCGKLVNTRKNDPTCMPQVATPPLSTLVTSLGGSGTHVVSFELCKIGLDMPHENMGVDGAVVSTQNKG
jgi:hypothetical protein